jgi:hypothetical protein|tara:strand:+ start:290 stop:556 length:267 start_codon:yes stop_codon:yes gene_type:complete
MRCIPIRVAWAFPLNVTDAVFRWLTGLLTTILPRSILSIGNWRWLTGLLITFGWLLARPGIRHIRVFGGLLRRYWCFRGGGLAGAKAS